MLRALVHEHWTLPFAPWGPGAGASTGSRTGTRHVRPTSPPLPLRRRLPLGLVPYGGGAYWCLHRAVVDYVHQFVGAYPEIVRFFEHVFVPDELFFQTIVLNSALRNGRERGPPLHRLVAAEPAPAMLARDDLAALDRARASCSPASSTSAWTSRSSTCSTSVSMTSSMRSRVAYVVLTHKNPRQVGRLLRRLSTDRSRFLVHVDRRAGRAVDADMRRHAAAVPRVQFLRRRRCFWAGFGMVRATLGAFDHVVRQELRSTTSSS